jgi:4-hydroxy-4-methyl-2-oxoglutarate aldolase
MIVHGGVPCHGAKMLDNGQVQSRNLLDEIRQFDTCTIANAIEQFDVRLRNEGYTRPGLRCVTGGEPRLLGYAATARLRSADPPMSGKAYLDRTDWWEIIARLPMPRIAVIQDLDTGRGAASCVGEVHAAILKALGCVGVITNGAVRDLPGVRGMGFPMLAGSVAVSHSYSHLVDCGEPVEIFGLGIAMGDLIYADCHGAISIPREIAAELPAAAARIRNHEQRIVAVCQSPDFSQGQLLQAIRSSE